MRDLWVYMTDPSIANSAAMFPFKPDQHVTINDGAISIQSDLVSTAFTDPLVEWSWYGNAKRLDNGDLFESLPSLQAQSDVLVKAQDGGSFGGTVAVHAEDPYVANATTSEVVISPVDVMPQIRMKCVARSEKGFTSTSNYFNVYAIQVCTCRFGGSLISPRPNTASPPTLTLVPRPMSHSPHPYFYAHPHSKPPGAHHGRPHGRGHLHIS